MKPTCWMHFGLDSGQHPEFWCLVSGEREASLRLLRGQTLRRYEVNTWICDSAKAPVQSQCSLSP